jgi:hypothetical protein
MLAPRTRAGILLLALLAAVALFLVWNGRGVPTPVSPTTLHHAADAEAAPRLPPQLANVVFQELPAPIVAAPVAPPRDKEILPAEPPRPESEVEKRMAAAPYADFKPSEASRAERDEQVARVKDSGPGGSEWRDYFNKVSEEWLGMDNKAGLGVVLEEWECHRLGCFTTVTVRTVRELERFNQLVRSGSAVHNWRGAGFVSGPVQNDAGELEVTWVFFAPPRD